MNAMDVDVQDVVPMHQHARFYKEGDFDMVEISYVGSKDTMVKKVAPDHMARFRNEWNAYCDGGPIKRRTGTALTEVPGLNESVAERFIAQNVHTAEELAALNDAQCQALGHGTLTFRNSARGLLDQRKQQRMEEIQKRIGKASAASISELEAKSEMDAKYASKADVDALSAKMDAILAVLSDKPKRGRPPKAKDE